MPPVAKAPRTEAHPFKGRTVAIVNDLGVEEQWYLYQKARDLRAAVASDGDLSSFRLSNSEMAVYSIFMEDSTRTKESFRNAAMFHDMKVNMFDGQNSSLSKGETITDTIKMLTGYSTKQSIFVIRSKIEGVCTWLEGAISKHAQDMGVPRPSFVNAGDGRHEHPSQELLDEFSFLEQLNWDRSHIHLALLGDLFHGRTVHSKVDGLKLYGRVEVDLIAPTELALPPMYEERMLGAGYVVRKFGSIAEYLEQPKVAKLWYFTRLQLERMGEKVLTKSVELRKAVTMIHDFIEKLPPKTKFFHPLPRDGRHPTLPFWLDKTEFNGYDRQSQNGYFTRIVLLGMLGGHFGADFQGKPKQIEESTASEPYTHELALTGSCAKLGSGVVAPRGKGLVLEGIAEGRSVDQIWAVLYMIRSALNLHGAGSQGVEKSAADAEKFSGFLTIPDIDISSLGSEEKLTKLAALAPGSVLKDVTSAEVKKAVRLSLPAKLERYPELICKNEACMSNPKSGQREVFSSFERIPGQSGTFRYACKYCETVHEPLQLWERTKSLADTLVLTPFAST